MKNEENVLSYKLSNRAIRELKAQAKKTGFDLLHDLMLNDYIETSDGSFLKRNKGHVGYDEFKGKPNLNKVVIERMKNEIEELSPETRNEVLNKIAISFPDIVPKIKDIYIKYRNSVVI